MTSEVQGNISENINLGKNGYPEVKEADWENLVAEIRRAGKAKEEFRRRFQLMALLHTDYLLKGIKKGEIVTKNTKFFSVYWADNTDRMAELITEIVINEIEKGKFDKYDAQGEIKVKSYSGILRDKMNKVAIDLINARLYQYKRKFDEDMPHEKKQIQFLEELSNAEQDILAGKKLQTRIRKEKRKLHALEAASSVIDWLRFQAKDQQKEKNVEQILLKNIRHDVAKVIIECFKSLTPIQKMYVSFSSIGFNNKAIAEMLEVSAPNVTQRLRDALAQMTKCLKQNHIDSPSELFGD